MAEGTYTLPDLLPYTAQMQDTGKPVTTAILSLFEKDGVAFLHPLKNTVIDGTEYIGVAAVEDLDVLNELLSLNLFGGAGYSHVVTKQGNTVIRSNHETNTFRGYNIFKYLESASFEDGLTVDTIRQDFAGGRSRKIHYKVDGQDLLYIYVPVQYEDWVLFTVIPSDILTAKTSQFYSLTLLSCAVISALFLLLLIIIFIILMRSRRRLTDQLYTDPVTGGISKIKFEMDAAASLRSVSQCSVLYANVDKFKLVNERDGNKAGDMLLKSIYQVFVQDMDSAELVSRLMADHFGILVTTRDMAFLQRRVEDWGRRIQEQASLLHITTHIHMDYGVVPVDNRGETISLLLDKANLVRKIARPGSVMAVYDEALANRLKFEEELENGQEKALVRWITPDKGMLYPDQYIPLFESNGFIAKVDLYVFEQTCRFIRRLINEGRAPLPISVNVSRFNLNNPDFVQNYVRVWAAYKIDASLLEFEITETLVYENMERLNLLLDNLHQCGFRISMDDFGNGYSSLNMLKEVDMDVLKLDRGFFGVNGT